MRCRRCATPGGNQHLGLQGHNQDFLPYITLSGGLAIGKHEDILFFND
jgi:hypothetical protein